MASRFNLVFLTVGLCLTAPPLLSTSAQPSSPAPDTSSDAPRTSVSAGTDSASLGVVWTPPNAPGPALRTLNRIHAAGARAVRLTRLSSADTLFARADSLGLRLFIDLPVAYVSAPALRDSLRQAQSTLGRLRALARRHASVQYVGLARHADTTVPTACSVLAEWTTRLHGAPASLRTYYVTPFPRPADQCADAVDLALLDTRGRPDPVDRWRTWKTDTTQTGLGALGTWVDPDAASGLRVPHSPERQARYLERAFSTLLDADPSRPGALFVYRWQDRTAPLSIRRYGLHDTTGTPRPAAEVVEGVYTDTQHVFAFPSGTAPSSAPHLILFGWGLIALLAGLYAQSPFFRQTAFRYFAAHGFYRDAVQEGRDVGPIINTVLLLSATIAFGLIVVLLSRIASAAPPTEHLLAALLASLRPPLATGLAQPGLAGLLVGGGSLVLVIGWMLGLVLVSRQEMPLSLAQGLMLVTWPCWPVVIALIVALVATRASTSPLVLGILVLGGVGGVVAVTVRVLRDYRGVTNVPLPSVIGLAVLSPFSLLLIGAILVVTQYDLPLLFLWRLLVQT
jgi:hypothetical protein